jgi:hypothetical protein
MLPEKRPHHRPQHDQNRPTAGLTSTHAAKSFYRAAVLSLHVCAEPLSTGSQEPLRLKRPAAELARKMPRPTAKSAFGSGKANAFRIPPGSPALPIAQAIAVIGGVGHDEVGDQGIGLRDRLSGQPRARNEQGIPARARPCGS